MAAQIIFPGVKSQSLLPEDEVMALGSQSFLCKQSIKKKGNGASLVLVNLTNAENWVIT